MMPPIKQTARKSTGKPSHPNSNTENVEPIRVRLRNSTPIRTQTQRSSQSQINGPATTLGPTRGQTPIIYGQGRGKGGLRRMRRRMRRCERSVDRQILQSIRPQIERRTSEDSLRSLRRIQAASIKEHDIPFKPFVRVVKDIANEISHNNMRPTKFQVAALHALREASDAFMVRFFEQCSFYTAHAKRVTLMVKDVDLAKKINSRFANQV